MRVPYHVELALVLPVDSDRCQELQTSLKIHTLVNSPLAYHIRTHIHGVSIQAPIKHPPANGWIRKDSTLWF